MQTDIPHFCGQTMMANPNLLPETDLPTLPNKLSCAHFDSTSSPPWNVRSNDYDIQKAATRRWSTGCLRRVTWVGGQIGRSLNVERFRFRCRSRFRGFVFVPTNKRAYTRMADIKLTFHAPNRYTWKSLETRLCRSLVAIRNWSWK